MLERVKGFAAKKKKEQGNPLRWGKILRLGGLLHQLAELDLEFLLGALA